MRSSTKNWWCMTTEKGLSRYQGQFFYFVEITPLVLIRLIITEYYKLLRHG